MFRFTSRQINAVGKRRKKRGGPVLFPFCQERRGENLELIAKSSLRCSSIQRRSNISRGNNIYSKKTLFCLYRLYSTRGGYFQLRSSSLRASSFLLSTINTQTSDARLVVTLSFFFAEPFVSLRLFFCATAQFHCPQRLRLRTDLLATTTSTTTSSSSKKRDNIPDAKPSTAVGLGVVQGKEL